MFELKTNEEIGAYLKKLIIAKYESQRQFCVAYIDLIPGVSQDSRDEEIRKLTNRLSQILKGKKGIQTHDLPIFSELLGVSCEEMLSAGATCTPIVNRRTNYNIAFSTNERDWMEYINHQSCIASYADEFGKTVVDYAIEFQNYGFIKFLIEKGKITLVHPKNYDAFYYGATTTFKRDPFSQGTLEMELLDNKLLRTQIIALALKHNDYSVLNDWRAREFPPQQDAKSPSLGEVKFNEYSDETYLDAILNAETKIIEYFCEEYKVKIRFGENYYLWIFPFIGQLIEKAVKADECKATILLDAAIKHNEYALKELKSMIQDSIKTVLKHSVHDNPSQLIDYCFHLNEEKNVYSYEYYYSGSFSHLMLTNIVHADVSSKKPAIQSKLDRLNELYSKIINIQDYWDEPTP